MSLRSHRLERSEGPILLSANCAWNIATFRTELIVDLLAAGYPIVTAAADDGHGERVRALGVEFISLPIDSAGTSVAGDLRLFLAYRRLFRDLRPRAFLGFTVKPNIYGSLAARLAGVPAINNISGLGSVFIKGGPLSRLVSLLYRAALARSLRVFFQNRDDLQLFVRRRLVMTERCAVIPGSGVDLERFTPGDRGHDGPFRFLLVARLLRDKGIGEYVDAARQLKARHPDVRFQLLGAAGADNPTAVPDAEIERWAAEKDVEYLGESNDVRPHIAAADCLVLPSYREGLPRSLLEGAAMARPLIATDVPGCREVVAVGDNGLLCAPRSAGALAAAMEKMLALAPVEREEMGRRGRTKVEREFDHRLVSDAYLETLA